MSEDALRGAGGRGVSAARSNFLLYPVIAVVGLVSSVVVARALPLEDFALYAIALAFRGTAQFLADMGTGGAASRAFAQMRGAGARRQALDLYGRLAALRLLMATLLILAVALLPGALSGALDLAPGERDFLWFAGVIGALEIAAGLGYYALNGLFEHPFVNRVTLAQGLLQPAAVVAASVAGLGLEGILAGVALGSLLRATALNAGALRRIRAIEETGERLSRVGRDYTGVAGAIAIGKAAAWAHSRQAVTLLVAAAADRRELALFSLAYDFAHSTLAAAMGPASGLATPAFSIQDTDARRRELFRASARLIAFLTFPAAALLMALAPALVPLLFGERYDGAVPFLQVILPLLAVDLALSTAATGLMTARTTLLRAYAAVKLATLVTAAAYLLIGGDDLLAVAALMLGVRLVSTLALHAVLAVRAQVTVEIGRLAALLAVCAAAAGAAALSRAALGEGVLAVLLPALLFAFLLAVLARALRLVVAADADLARRILPASAPLLRLVAPPRP